MPPRLVMRIVLTCNFSPWSSYSGGGQRSTHNLASALAERGHDVTVIFTKPPHETVEAPAQLPYRLRWAALPALRSKVNASFRPLTAVSVAHAVEAELRAGAQVVHGGGEEAALLPSLKRKHRFALVVTPRYPSLPEPLSSGTMGTRDWARMALTDTKYVTLAPALRGADAVSPPSHFAGALMQKAYGLREAQVRPVHNGVPAEFLNYHWAPTSGATDERPLLFFGRFAHDKGVDTLIEALARLERSGPAAVLAGRGPWRDKLAGLIEERRLSDRVTLLDWLSHEELGDWLTRASMAVIPSIEENFSLAVLSVLAVGTPLITTPVGGTPEVMTDGETGLLVPAGNVTALAQAISDLRANPGRAASMGAVGRRRVRADFTWQATAEKFEALYAEILARSPRS